MHATLGNSARLPTSSGKLTMRQESWGLAFNPFHLYDEVLPTAKKTCETSLVFHKDGLILKYAKQSTMNVSQLLNLSSSHLQVEILPVHKRTSHNHLTRDG